jgi:pimeloyl-ACP methyl ester carboxylesterase
LHLNPFFTLALILLIALLALLSTLVLAMTRMLLRPPRMTDGKAAYVLKRLSPGDLGLHFQALKFTVTDELTRKPLKLAAWWIPHPAAAGKCVVLIHGYGDAKVGAIAWAPMWHSLGYHILAIDLRAHGESEGDYTTGGYFERHDLNQILDQLRAAYPADTATLVLFGISLGAAVALGAAETRDDVAALILDSPFTEYSRAVRAHATTQNMPATFLVPIVLALSQQISGADFNQARPLDLIARVKCPVMLIAGESDPFAPPEDLANLEEAIKARSDPQSVFWKVLAAHHVQSLSADAEAYRARIESFLKRALDRTPVSSLPLDSAR